MAQSGGQSRAEQGWRGSQLLLCVAEAMSDFDTIYMRSSSGGKQVCVPSLLFRHHHRKGRKEFCILFYFLPFFCFV